MARSFSYSGPVGESETGNSYRYDYSANGNATSTRNQSYYQFERNADDTHRTFYDYSAGHSAWDNYDYDELSTYSGGHRTITDYGIGGGGYGGAGFFHEFSGWAPNSGGFCILGG